MDITEQQIMEALGVGAKEQASAEPAAQPSDGQSDEGAKEQVTAEPAGSDPTTAQEEEGGSAAEESGSEGEPGETNTETPGKRRQTASAGTAGRN